MSFNGLFYPLWLNANVTLCCACAAVLQKALHKGNVIAVRVLLIKKPGGFLTRPPPAPACLPAGGRVILFIIFKNRLHLRLAEVQTETEYYKLLINIRIR